MPIQYCRLSTLVRLFQFRKSRAREVGVFPAAEQHIIRSRLARSFRYIVSQRLLPRKDGKGRVAALEILKSTLRTREYVERGEQEGKTLLDAMRDGDTDGMQDFDGEIEKLIRAGVISIETGLVYATNPGNLRLQLADLGESGSQVGMKEPVKTVIQQKPSIEPELVIE